MLDGQDFRHATQEMRESVAEYIRRLEKLFQAAYGRDDLSVETRQTLLYSQLQEGLKYGLIKSPAVSGADSYNQLCIAARHEEKRLNELSRCQQYLKDVGKKGDAGGRSQPNSTNKPSEKRGENRGEPRQCYVCGDTDHLARNSNKKKKTESTGQTKRNTDAGTKMVKSKSNEQQYQTQTAVFEGVLLCLQQSGSELPGRLERRRSGQHSAGRTRTAYANSSSSGLCCRRRGQRRD